MTVTVRIFGGLQRHVGGRTEIPLDFSAPVQTGEVPRLLGIPKEEVWFVAVNGVRAPEDYILSPGDRVDVFAPVGGG